MANRTWFASAAEGYLRLLAAHIMHANNLGTSPSEELPFQKNGLALWREIISEVRKLRLDRSPTIIGIDPAYLSTRFRVAKIYSSVEAWHGTGRYQYSSSGEIIDVLEGIIREGGLIPHCDDWDVQKGTMQVISTALSRMYARLYAGMHYPCGRRISNELGTRELWGYYFFVTSCIIAIIEYRLSPRAVLRRDLTALIPDVAKKVRRWSSKMSRIEVSHKDAFLKGTDIAFNYPILIGIRDGAFIPAETSKFINLHERRAEAPVLLKDMSHMEVPLDRVAETLEFLHRSGIDSIPIIPIEFGEEYCRSFSFWKLVSGKWLKARGDGLVDAT